MTILDNIPKQPNVRMCVGELEREYSTFRYCLTKDRIPHSPIIWMENSAVIVYDIYTSLYIITSVVGSFDARDIPCIEQLHIR